MNMLTRSRQVRDATSQYPTCKHLQLVSGRVLPFEDGLGVIPSRLTAFIPRYTTPFMSRNNAPLISLMSNVYMNIFNVLRCGTVYLVYLKIYMIYRKRKCV